MVIGIPESPRWLVIYKKDYSNALRVLMKNLSRPEAEKMLTEIKVHSQAGAGSSAKDRLFSRKYSFVLILAFLIAFFNQLSGINFILYYAPEILEKAGFATSDSLFSSISIGVVNLIFTMLGLSLIDRAGRKQLMLIGSIGYIISLVMVGYGFYIDAGPVFKLMFILMFIASHAIGQGAVIWVFISEIFPNHVRAKGQSWGCGTHWVFAALITLFGAVLINTFEPHVVFFFFAAFMVLQLLFVIFIMPETKGVSLEKLQDRLVRNTVSEDDPFIAKKEKLIPD